MWPFKKKTPSETEQRFQAKIKASQEALLAAAISTADMANDVTTRLRSRLEDSVRQFEMITRLMNDGLLICDQTGQVIAANGAIQAAFGRDVTGEPVKALIPSLDLGTAANEIPFLTQTATKQQVRLTASKLERAEREPIFLVIVETLFEDQRYSVLFENSFDAILVVQGTEIIACNSAANATFGFKDGELVRQPVTAFLPWPITDGGGQATNREGGSFLVSLACSTISTRQGDMVLVTIRDVSAAERLRDLAARDNGIDMICCFKPDFSITFVNELYARRHGMTRMDMVSDDVRATMDEQEKACFSANVALLTPEQPSRRFHVQITNKAGETRVEDWIDTGVFQDGKLLEYHRFGRDVTHLTKR